MLNILFLHLGKTIPETRKEVVRQGNDIAHMLHVLVSQSATPGLPLILLGLRLGLSAPSSNDQICLVIAVVVGAVC